MKLTKKQHDRIIGEARRQASFARQLVDGLSEDDRAKVYRETMESFGLSFGNSMGWFHPAYWNPSCPVTGNAFTVIAKWFRLRHDENLYYDDHSGAWIAEVQPWSNDPEIVRLGCFGSRTPAIEAILSSRRSDD